jgi:hypothetical protein
MQKQIHEFKKTGKIPIADIIKIVGSVVPFFIELFKEKRSKDERLKHLEEIAIHSQKEKEEMKAEIEELKQLVSELLNR